MGIAILCIAIQPDNGCLRMDIVRRHSRKKLP